VVKDKAVRGDRQQLMKTAKKGSGDRRRKDRVSSVRGGVIIGGVELWNNPRLEGIPATRRGRTQGSGGLENHPLLAERSSLTMSQKIHRSCPVISIAPDFIINCSRTMGMPGDGVRVAIKDPRVIFQNEDLLNPDIFFQVDRPGW